MPLLLVAILLRVLDVSPETSLRLTLSAQKTQILVGEPLRVEVAWSSAHPIGITHSGIQLFVNDGSGFARWSETPSAYETRIDLAHRLSPGSVEHTAHVIAVKGPIDGVYRLAFPRTAQYQVLAKYKADDTWVASTPLMISVVQPQGRDEELLTNEILVRPILLSAQSRLLGDEKLESLFHEYGASTYLARARLMYLERRLDRAYGDAPDPVPPSAPVGGDVPQLLARLAAEDLGESVFDVERLLLLARTRDKTGRPTEAVQTWTHVLELYPAGHAADEARRRLHLPPFDR